MRLRLGMLCMQPLWVTVPTLSLSSLLLHYATRREMSSYLGGLESANQLRRLELLHRSLTLLCLPGSLKTLTELRIACKQLRGLPAGIGTLGSLRELELDGCAVIKLPSSLGDLKGLQRMRLINCEALFYLPESMAALTQLELLDLRGCSCLHNLPASILALQQSGTRILGASAMRQLSICRFKVHQSFLVTRSPIYACVHLILLGLWIMSLCAPSGAGITNSTLHSFRC